MTLENIIQKHKPELEFYPNSTANTVFFQLVDFSLKDESPIIELIDELIFFDLNIDDWLLYMLSKYLKIDSLEYLQSKGYDITQLDDNGENILFHLFKQTQFNFTESNVIVFKSYFERLVNLGLDYKCINHQGRNLIHIAATNGLNEDFISYLLNLGLEINKQDNDGYTPLHFSVENYHTETLRKIKYLLAIGAEPSKYIRTITPNYDTTDIPSLKGLTPLALFQNQIEEFGEDYYTDRLEIIEVLK